MLFRNISYIDENCQVKTGFVETSEAKITYIGSEAPEGNTGRVIDGKGKLLIPAFYNAHGHSPMSLMRGYGENMTLSDWLNKKIFPFEDKLTKNAVYWATLLSMGESAKFGIVSTSDMYYFTEDMVRAVTESGLKANISRSIVNFTGESFNQMESVTEMKSAVERFHKTAKGRVLMDASIHGEYTSDEATVRELSQYAKEHNLIMHIHLSETKDEHEGCKKRHNGLTPAAYFNKCGAFDIPALAAHCVWVTEEDIDILAEKNVTVCTNPVSNMKLASGICPTHDILKRGINLAIGTDSVASNNNLNFFEEMKMLGLSAKIKYMDPTVLTPEEIFRAATLGGAKAQGRDDCGAVKVGNKADLVLINLETPNMAPVHNAVNNLVYAATPNEIVMTISDGKIIYEKGEYKTIDMEKTIFEVKKAKDKILKSI